MRLFAAFAASALALMALSAPTGADSENSVKIAGRLLSLSTRRDSVSYVVGNRRFSHRGKWLAPGSALEAPFLAPREPCALLMRVVLPDDTRNHRMSYTVSLDSQPIAKRDLQTQGVGRRSQFARLESSALPYSKRHTLAVLNTGQERLFVEDALLLTGYQDELAQPYGADDFILSFLVPPGSLSPDTQSRLKAFHPARGITRALSAEFHYAARSPQDLVASAEAFKASADLLGWPVVVIPCSWWAGTPPEVSARPEFQQVCYSPTDTYDEGASLKALLGDAWSLHYGWTVPNIWSNTPWQTMNNPELNALRESRLSESLPRIIETLGSRLLCFITENEPMYWAGDFPDGNYPVVRKDLMADFNPATAASAARDGITLNPEDGLSEKERWWLFRNLTNYITTSASWIASLAGQRPVYTHAQVDEQFPMKYTRRYRPNLEHAVDERFPTGVEMLWDTDICALQRMREWGSWGLINREEGDSRPISQHIAMAAASYAMGAGILNSYNWLALKQDDTERYFNGFAALLSPSSPALPTPARWTATDRISWALPTNPDMPWFTRLDIALANPSPEPAILTLEVRTREGRRLVGWVSGSIPARAPQSFVSLELDSMTDAKQGEALEASLHSSQGIQIGLVASGAAAAQLEFNLVQERHRSQIIQFLQAH
ncbi:MAG: hypothetical protein IT209_11310 [Armatimonadetes bacterium]|nr:hypothetical protein [Armatimonadota bacterium]